MCCPLEDFIECDSNNLFHYRNKGEMNIGLNTEGEVAIGFIKGQFEKGF